MRAPENHAEWVEAVHLAVFSISFANAQKHGFLSGVTVDVKRCQWTIDEARKRGIIQMVTATPPKAA